MKTGRIIIIKRKRMAMGVAMAALMLVAVVAAAVSSGAGVTAAGGGTTGVQAAGVTQAPANNIVGGGTIVAPAVCAQDANNWDLFVRGLDSSLLHKHYQLGSGWSDWENLGGKLAPETGPGAASWGSGRLDVVVTGTDYAVYHKSWSGSGWSGWEYLGGDLATWTGPAASSWGSGRLDVFAVGTDNAVYHKSWSGSWSNWEYLGGQLAPVTDPAAASALGSGRIDVVAVGTDYGLYHKSWSGSWSGWEFIGAETWLSFSKSDLLCTSSPPHIWDDRVVFSGQLHSFGGGTGIQGKVIRFVDANGNAVTYNGAPLTATADGTGHYTTGSTCDYALAAVYLSTSTNVRAYFAGDNYYTSAVSA